MNTITNNNTTKSLLVNTPVKKLSCQFSISFKQSKRVFVIGQVRILPQPPNIICLHSNRHIKHIWHGCGSKETRWTRKPPDVPHKSWFPEKGFGKFGEIFPNPAFSFFWFFWGVLWRWPRISPSLPTSTTNRTLDLLEPRNNIKQIPGLKWFTPKFAKPTPKKPLEKHYKQPLKHQSSKKKKHQKVRKKTSQNQGSNTI